MVEYWNAERRCHLEGRAPSRPATTKRGPPEAIFPNIPLFPYSNIPVKLSVRKGNYEFSICTRA